MGGLQQNVTEPMRQNSALDLLDCETDKILTDSILMEKVVAGNRQALVAVYDRYSPLVYTLALQVTRHSDSAEDTLHEVFMELWRNPGTCNSATGTLVGWLSGRARQMAVSILHTKNQASQRPIAPPAAEESRVAKCVSYAGKIRFRLDKIPAHQREVFDLAYFSGFTYTEIAQNTSRPLAQVKSDICLALNAIRRPVSGGH